MKRMIVAVTVPDEMEDSDVAVAVDCALPDGVNGDATAWEWDRFWSDHAEGLVGPEGDTTQTLTFPFHYRDNGEPCPNSGKRRDVREQCSYGCSGADEHYANDGHPDCEKE